jgi:HD-like signal output (HDOD) protein
MKSQPVDLRAVLNETQLPALPQSAMRLLTWGDVGDVPATEFAAPIEADPGMAGQVLRFVNSSYFGFSREIANVKLAVTMVGARTIKNFALWSAVFSLMPNPRCGVFDMQSLWRDSLKRGLLARALAKSLKIREVEEAFAAALLQDMSLPVLVRAMGEQYAALLSERQAAGRRLSDLERDRFGWTHADAGRQMAQAWNLPTGMAELVGNHTVNELLFANDRPAGAQLAVTLSALAPSYRDETWPEQETFESAYETLFPAEKPSLGELFARVDAEYDAFAPALKMTGPTQPLTRFYREQAAV